MDYAALKAKDATYASEVTDAARLADMTAKTIATAVDVPTMAVFNKLLVRGVWPAIELFSRSAPNGDTTHDNALGAAIALVRKVSADPGGFFYMTDAAAAATALASLDFLIAAGAISLADKAAVLALATVNVSWADQNDCRELGPMDEESRLAHLLVARAS